MQKKSFGENLQLMRKSKNMSQKVFAEFLSIPQPTLSAYENGHTSPTLDVLVNLAGKCGVSLDWLCGASPAGYTISTTGDIADFFYQLMEIDGVKAEIDVNDRVDIETENDRNYVKITFYHNEKNQRLNKTVCGIISRVKNDYEDLVSYAISKDRYDMAREQEKEYHSTPVSRKEFPELSREELLRKRREYMETHPYE